MVNRQPCDECRDTHKRASTPTRWRPNPEKQHPPCGTCRPEIHPYNRDAFELYSLASRTWQLHPVNGEAMWLVESELEVIMNRRGIPLHQREARAQEVHALAAMVRDCWEVTAQTKQDPNGNT